jgi:hypothetical protein
MLLPGMQHAEHDGSIRYVSEGSAGTSVVGGNNA